MSTQQPRTWTASQIREMLLDMMKTDTGKYDDYVRVDHLVRYFSDRGIDMRGKTVTVYNDEQ